MLSYRHFRLMIVEELDPSKHLDEQLLKMLNGGGCDNRGRVCGSQSVDRVQKWQGRERE